MRLVIFVVMAVVTDVAVIIVAFAADVFHIALTERQGSLWNEHSH